MRRGGRAEPAAGRPELTIDADAASRRSCTARASGSRARSRTCSTTPASGARPGGTIEVELHDGTLSVRDHGPGFHEEDLPFVFDRFHRARDARAKPGSGLGLAIVRQAAEAHGGFVEAANAPGGGALLRLGFGPLLQLGEEASEPAINAPGHTRWTPGQQHASVSERIKMKSRHRVRSSGASDGVHAHDAPASRGSPSRSSIVCSTE